MRNELTKKVVPLYPKMYKRFDTDVPNSRSYTTFEIGDGWFTIIHGLSLAIQTYIDNRTRERWRIRHGMRKYAKMSAHEQFKNSHLNLDRPPKVQQVEVTQVKEKFGSLRFYYQGGDSTVDNYVAMAEAMSYVTCEICGAPGHLVVGGWTRVLCPSCSSTKEQ